MKKTIAVLTLGAVMCGASIAYADEGRVGETRGRRLLEGKLEAKVKLGEEMRLNHEEKVKLGKNMFVVMGEVKSTTSNTIVVDAKRGAHMKNEVGETVTIKTDTDTKFTADGKAIALADIKAGFRVLIKGDRANNTLTANAVMVLANKSNKKAYGEITAVTSNSVTIKNSATGETTVVSFDEDTKVMINGEVKTTTDIKTGDKGFIKIRSTIDGIVAKIIRLFR